MDYGLVSRVSNFGFMDRQYLLVYVILVGTVTLSWFCIVGQHYMR
jgi:hypothetical protein